MMYGQMTAGSWIYIGTQGILQGTYETFAASAARHFGGSLAGRLVVTAGLGGMGGAQPLAATRRTDQQLVVTRGEQPLPSSADQGPEHVAHAAGGHAQPEVLRDRLGGLAGTAEGARDEALRPEPLREQERALACLLPSPLGQRNFGGAREGPSRVPFALRVANEDDPPGHRLSS